MTISHNRSKKERRDEGRSQHLYGIRSIGKAHMEYIKMRARARKAKQQQESGKVAEQGT